MGGQRRKMLRNYAYEISGMTYLTLVEGKPQATASASSEKGVRKNSAV